VIERRYVSPVIPGRIVHQEDRAPRDHGVGRSCATCGGNVSRYSAPAPDGLAYCSQHWHVEDDVQLLPGQSGALRAVRGFKPYVSPAEAEALRVDAEVGRACEAEVRLDEAVTLNQASKLLGRKATTLAGRVEGLIPVAFGQADAPKFPLGAIIGLAAFGAPAAPLVEAVEAPPSPVARGSRALGAARRRAALVEASGLTLDDLVTLGEAGRIFELRDYRQLQRMRERAGAEPRGERGGDGGGQRAKLYRLGDLVGDVGGLEAA
jgi:hypothetical protein